jgi:thiamine pyrophosphokinase
MDLNLTHYFDPSSIAPSYNILVLNQDILHPHFKILYERASIKICADGGYDKLKHWIESTGQKLAFNQPDFVIGDLDSIETEKISQDGTGGILKKPRFIRIHDQSRTDLEKSIDYIVQNISFGFQNFILVGALGGRFDHEIGSISAMFKYTDHNLILLNNQSAITLLKPVTVCY